MTAQIFSTRNRPFHLGSFPMERLVRHDQSPDLSDTPPFNPVSFDHTSTPRSLVNAMRDYQAMLDVLRGGMPSPQKAGCPDDPEERARHIKSFGYFQNVPMVGIGRFDKSLKLDEPFANPEIDRLAEDLKTKQVKSLASGIDVIMADLKESVSAPPQPVDSHTHTIVFLYNYNRDPDPDEPGYSWMGDAQAQRACLLGTEAAVVIASYLRILGYDAKVHSGASSDVDLNKLAVVAGLAVADNGQLVNPFVGNQFQLVAITTNFDMATDKPLAPMSQQPKTLTNGLAWKLGSGCIDFARTA